MQYLYTIASLLIYLTPLAAASPGQKVTDSMFLVPGATVQVTGTTRDYERAPVSTVRQEGKVIIANYPRENTLSTFDTPEYRSRVGGFWIDKTSVSNQEYAKFMASGNRPAPSSWMDGKIPSGQETRAVTGVSYDDAASYAAWAGKRLPTMSEFERALNKNASIRIGSPQKEWTATPSNPGQSPEKYYRYGGTPGERGQVDNQTGFRTVLDDR